MRPRNRSLQTKLRQRKHTLHSCPEVPWALQTASVSSAPKTKADHSPGVVPSAWDSKPLHTYFGYFSHSPLENETCTPFVSLKATPKLKLNTCLVWDLQPTQENNFCKWTVQRAVPCMQISRSSNILNQEIKICLDVQPIQLPCSIEKTPAQI